MKQMQIFMQLLEGLLVPFPSDSSWISSALEMLCIRQEQGQNIAQRSVLCYTFRDVGWDESRDDVIIGDDHIGWNEVRSLGQCWMGAEGTGQDTTRNWYQDFGI